MQEKDEEIKGWDDKLTKMRTQVRAYHIKCLIVGQGHVVVYAILGTLRLMSGACSLSVEVSHPQARTRILKLQTELAEAKAAASLDAGMHCRPYHRLPSSLRIGCQTHPWQILI